MSEDERQPQPEAAPAPIPDGGLSSAMPAWLQQPPAWKREPVQVPAAVRTLPPPDASTIDPATLLDIDDLPAWLRNLAREAPRANMESAEAVAVAASSPTEPVSNSDSAVLPVGEAEASLPVDSPLSVTIPDARNGGESGAAPESTLFNVPIHDAGGSHDQEPAPDRSSSPPWWLSDRVLGLVLLGIVLAMIYVVLVASGTI